MKQVTFWATFTRQQRKGIIALFLLMVLIQAGYFILQSVDIYSAGKPSNEEQEWLALQPKIDELKAKDIDKSAKLYPFNPNFISDYKGYSLGMSVVEINRLHKFREQGNWINSAEDFKKVTNVHDTLLAKLAPYFKFPHWINKKKQQKKQEQYVQYDRKSSDSPKADEKKIP